MRDGFHSNRREEPAPGSLLTAVKCRVQTGQGTTREECIAGVRVTIALTLGVQREDA